MFHLFETLITSEHILVQNLKAPENEMGLFESYVSLVERVYNDCFEEQRQDDHTSFPTMTMSK